MKKGIFLFVCVILPLVLGFGNSSPGKGQNLARTRSEGPGPRALAYLNAVNQVFAHCSAQMAGDPVQEIRALRIAAYHIQQMPPLGIDPTVVGWALRGATVCEQRANLTENSNDPARLVAASVRGANGDPPGVSGELLEAMQQRQRNYQVVRQEGIEPRARLTAHYGIECPLPQF